jgi:hypothetical protein
MLDTTAPEDIPSSATFDVYDSYQQTLANEEVS